MKTKKMVILGLTLGALALISSCKNTAKECASLLASVTVADTAYYNSQNVVNCKAYKAALKAWVDETDCSDKDAVRKAQFIAEMGALNCP